jgi:hypothetical protein
MVPPVLVVTDRRDCVTRLSPGPASLSGFMWWVLRRSIRRVPEIRQWLEALSTS